MASGPTTSWQVEGEKVEVVIGFLFLGSKITKVVTASMKSEDICFLDMINLESVLKSRDITLPTKVCIIKAMVISEVMYGCESCTIKKAERWRTGIFELWCWITLLRVAWTARRSNQSVLREINPECSVGRTDAETETPVFWSSDANSRLTGNVPDSGKDWGKKEMRASENEMAGWHHWCNGHGLGKTLGVGEGEGGLEWCSPWGRKESDMNG